MGRSVAIVAWYFPPAGGAGAQRPLHFATGMAADGDVVSVLAPPLVRSDWAPDDRSLAAEADGLDLRRLDGREGESVPETLERFRHFVVEQLRVGRPDVVVITMSPFGLASLLDPLRRLGIPVVLDLRDPWALDAWPGYRSRFDWWRELRRMHHALRASDGFVMNTKDALEAVLDRMPDLRFHPHVVVENGWSARDFTEAESASSSLEGEPFRIVHSGTLHPDRTGSRSVRSWARDRLAYAPQWIDRTGRGPRHVIRAVDGLRRRDVDVRLEFVGTSGNGVREIVSEEGGGDFVEITGYQEHQAAVRAIRTADALFLPLGGLRPGERSLIVPGKTYEYLVAGPPIVAALPEGDVRDLVACSERGFLCEPCCSDSIAAAILSAMEWGKSRRDHAPVGAEPFMHAYERRALTSRLRTFLDSVLSGAT